MTSQRIDDPADFKVVRVEAVHLTDEEIKEWLAALRKTYGKMVEATHANIRKNV